MCSSLYLYLHWSAKCAIPATVYESSAQLCVLTTTPIESHCRWFFCVWLLLKRTSIRPGKFPFWKSMLKLLCCVFDAIIKKSHFICIINATEVKRRERKKTALNFQRNTKSLFFFICQFLRRWPEMCLPPLGRGCHGRGGCCLNWSCENTLCNNLSKRQASWTKGPTRSFRTTQRAAKISATPFYFFCSVFPRLSHWRFSTLP